MDLVATIRKSGSRGGVNFSWDDVATSTHRENYLGHSIKAPVGRWAKGRDATWYDRGGQWSGEGADDAEAAADQAERDRRDEIRRIKEAEEDAMAHALGLPPPVRGAAIAAASMAEAPDRGGGGNGAGGGPIEEERMGGAAEAGEDGKRKRRAERRRSRHKSRSRSRSRDRQRRRRSRSAGGGETRHRQDTRRGYRSRDDGEDGHGPTDDRRGGRRGGRRDDKRDYMRDDKRKRKGDRSLDDHEEEKEEEDRKRRRGRERSQSPRRDADRANPRREYGPDAGRGHRAEAEREHRPDVEREHKEKGGRSSRHDDRFGDDEPGRARGVRARGDGRSGYDGNRYSRGRGGR